MNGKLGAYVERAYWRWMLRTSSAMLPQGLRFIYVSARGDKTSAELQVVLVGALSRISQAKGGFGELVNSHLRFVAALDAPKPMVVVNARGYVTPFTDLEVSNEHYLACRLIWAATYVRLSRDAIVHKVTRDLDAIRRVSYEAQMRFTKQFADAKEWVEYLEQHPSGL